MASRLLDVFCFETPLVTNEANFEHLSNQRIFTDYRPRELLHFKVLLMQDTTFFFAPGASMRICLRIERESNEHGWAILVHPFLAFKILGFGSIAPQVYIINSKPLSLENNPSRTANSHRTEKFLERD